MMIACKNGGYKLLVMSATAATNQLEMKALGYATNLHNGANFCKWCVNMGAEYNERFGGMSIDLKSQKAQDGMRAIHTDLFDVQKIASRLTRKDMKSMFPDNRIYAELFDMGSNTAKIQSVYDRMEAEIARLNARAQNYKAHVFAEIMKARRLTELLKIPTMMDAIEDMFDEGISPVVFVNFQDSVEALQRMMAKNRKFDGLVGYVVGGQSDKARQRDIDGFQADELRIMIANTAAGNCGISLHDLNGNFPRHTINFPGWSAINLIQCLGRCHRVDGKTPVIQKIIFASGTIEERIAYRVQGKLDCLDMLNDGDLIGDIQILN
jgi:hypothetical protein